MPEKALSSAIEARDFPAATAAYRAQARPDGFSAEILRRFAALALTAGDAATARQAFAQVRARRSRPGTADDCLNEIEAHARDAATRDDHAARRILIAEAMRRFPLDTRFLECAVAVEKDSGQVARAIDALLMLRSLQPLEGALAEAYRALRHSLPGSPPPPPVPPMAPAPRHTVSAPAAATTPVLPLRVGTAGSDDITLARIPRPEVVALNRLISAQNYDEALTRLGEAAKSAPEDPVIHRLRAQIAIRRGARASAIPDLRAYVEKVPDDPWGLVTLATELSMTGASDEALGIARRAAAIPEAADLAAITEGDIALRRGDNATARAAFERVSPGSPHAARAATSLARLGQTPAPTSTAAPRPALPPASTDGPAVVTARRTGTAAAPGSSPDIELRLINLAIRERRLDEAEQLTRDYAAANPDAPLGDRLHAQIAMRRGDREAALPYLRRYVERVPDDAWGFATLAGNLSVLGDHTGALELVAAAPAAAADLMAVTEGDARARRGQWAAAADTFERVPEQSTYFRRAMLSLANAAERAGQLDRAERTLINLARTAPDDRALQDRLAALAATRTRMGLVAERVAEMAESPPQTTFDKVTLGDAWFGLEDPARALPLWDSAAGDMPADHGIALRQVAGLIRCGETDAAAQRGWALLAAAPPLAGLIGLARLAAQQDQAAFTAIAQEASAAVRARVRKPALARLGRVALIGGSNTIWTNGWGKALTASLDQLFGTKVKNFGLGGISSLFGAFVATDKAVFEEFDTVLFEYSLNDTYFNAIGSYPEADIRATLGLLASLVLAHGKRLVLVTLVPRGELRAVRAGESLVHRLYAELAAQPGIEMYDVPGYLFGQGLSPSYDTGAYVDDLHLGPFNQAAVADNLIVSLLEAPPKRSRRKAPAPDHTFAGLRMLPVDALAFTGETTRVHRETTYFAGDFVALKAPGTLRVRHAGRVLGLLVNNVLESGWVKASFGGKTIVKNIAAVRSLADRDKPRIYLRQFGEALAAPDGDEFVISLDVSRGDLKSYPIDPSPHQASTTAALGQQVLEIGGVLVA